MQTITRSLPLTELHTDEVVIISRGISKDFLISYINLTRQHFHLAPLEISPELDRRAKRKAYNLKQKISLPSFIDPLKVRLSIHGPRVILSPLTESREYLNYILNPKCVSVGICICEPSDVSQKSYTVQVFKMKE